MIRLKQQPLITYYAGGSRKIGEEKDVELLLTTACWWRSEVSTTIENGDNVICIVTSCICNVNNIPKEGQYYAQNGL